MKIEEFNGGQDFLIGEYRGESGLITAKKALNRQLKIPAQAVTAEMTDLW